MQKKYFKKLRTLLIVLLVSFIVFSSNYNILAQEASGNNLKNLDDSKNILKTVATGEGDFQGIGYKETEAISVISGIIQFVLSLIGIFFLILVIMGGYQWMTAGGNEETIAKAKKRIINATIGLTLVLAAYAISYFIIYMISEQTLTAIAPD